MTTKFPFRLVLLAAIVSCRDPIAPLTACDGQIEVSVGFGNRPSFAWTPNCGISFLGVYAVTSTSGQLGTAVWGFNAPEDEPIGPNVTYGAAPARASVWTGPEPLEAGKTYRITVWYTVGGDVVVAEGTTTFTWWPPD